MAVPKKRKTSTRGKQGRSHDSLKKVSIAKCPKCGDPILAHNLCPTCGHYRDREIIHVETKLDKKLKKEAKKKSDSTESKTEKED